jgi:hypothetical protein
VAADFGLDRPFQRAEFGTFNVYDLRYNFSFSLRCVPQTRAVAMWKDQHCAHCGRSFEPRRFNRVNRGNQRYCTEECCKAAHSKRVAASARAARAAYRQPRPVNIAVRCLSRGELIRCSTRTAAARRSTASERWDMLPYTRERGVFDWRFNGMEGATKHPAPEGKYVKVACVDLAPMRNDLSKLAH